MKDKAVLKGRGKKVLPYHIPFLSTPLLCMKLSFCLLSMQVCSLNLYLSLLWLSAVTVRHNWDVPVSAPP